MKLPNISGAVRLFGVGKALVMAHRPEILFGASVVGTVSSVVLAAKGGYEARGVIEAERDRRIVQAIGDTTFGSHEEYREAVRRVPNLTTKEHIQLTWLCYMPAAITTFGTLGATTGLHIVHVKEKKAIAAAALMAIEEVKTEAKQYVDDVMEAIDEGSTEKGKEKIQKALDEKPQPGWITDGDGELEELYLVRDAWTGRDIFSNKRRVEEAVNELNGVINTAGDVDLNTFYSYAGYGTIPQGDELGWGGETLLTLKWENGVRDDDRPIRVFTFRTEPKKGYSDPHR